MEWGERCHTLSIVLESLPKISPNKPFSGVRVCQGCVLVLFLTAYWSRMMWIWSLMTERARGRLVVPAANHSGAISRQAGAEWRLVNT